MMDRIEIIYNAIDEIFKVHGTKRPARFGGGLWDYEHELIVWKKQIIDGEIRNGIKPLTNLQWSVINSYIETKKKDLTP